jgi:hypothetical protein
LSSGFKRSRDRVTARRNSNCRDFQLKGNSRYKNVEEKSVEAKASGIGHGRREVRRKTNSWRVKINCALRVI